MSIICGDSVVLSVKSCIVSVCHYQNGDSALMMAASDVNTEIMSILVKAGANTDLINKVIIFCVVSFMPWVVLLSYYGV